MKYQFTTEGSTSQTKYYKVNILGPTPEEGILFSAIVSTPLTLIELDDVLEARLNLNEHCCNLSTMIEDTKRTSPCMGLDSICRVIANIKPLKQKVIISICGERKVYELDADKLESLLKSLE